MIFFVCVLSRVWSFATLWTVVCQAPLSMGFSRQEYWSGLPFPTPRDLPILGSNPHLLQILNWQAGSLPLSHLGSPWYFITAAQMNQDTIHIWISIQQQQKQYNVLPKKNATIAHINENKFILPSKRGNKNLISYCIQLWKMSAPLF